MNRDALLNAYASGQKIPGWPDCGNTDFQHYVGRLLMKLQEMAVQQDHQEDRDVIERVMAELEGELFTSEAVILAWAAFWQPILRSLLPSTDFEVMRAEQEVEESGIEPPESLKEPPVHLLDGMAAASGTPDKPYDCSGIAGGFVMSARLSKVTLTLCDACLDGDGGECHVPGCALWMSTAPDINLRERITDSGGSIERIHDNVEHEFEGDKADCKVCGESRQHYLHGSLHPAGFSVGIKPCGTCDIYPGDSRCTECDHYTGT